MQVFTHTTAVMGSPMDHHGKTGKILPNMHKITAFCSHHQLPLVFPTQVLNSGTHIKRNTDEMGDTTKLPGGQQSQQALA